MSVTYLWIKVMVQRMVPRDAVPSFMVRVVARAPTAIVDARGVAAVCSSSVGGSDDGKNCMQLANLPDRLPFKHHTTGHMPL